MQRTALCKTFAGGISKTAAGGEINCLDPGGYGMLTITKSLSIDCTGTLGSTLNSGGINGFVINDSLAASPGTAEVRLRGLQINGAGTTPALNGIRFIRGKSLVVEDVFIQNQKSGSGISIAPSAGTVKIEINHVTIVDSGNAGTQGLEIRPTGAGVAQIGLRNVKLANNSGNGVRVDSSAATGAAVVAIEDTQISGSVNGLSVVAGPGSVVFVDDTQIFSNSNVGIAAQGANARIRVRQAVITGNLIGLNIAAGAFINDLGDNVIIGNTTNGAFN